MKFQENPTNGIRVTAEIVRCSSSTVPLIINELHSKHVFWELAHSHKWEFS